MKANAKKLTRLKAAAQMGNHPAGFMVLNLVDYDGGDFDLLPIGDEVAIYLPHPEQPGYRVAISGENPEVLERFGRAILALARKQRDGDDDTDTDS